MSGIILIVIGTFFFGLVAGMRIERFLTARDAIVDA